MVQQQVAQRQLKRAVPASCRRESLGYDLTQYALQQVQLQPVPVMQKEWRQKGSFQL